MSSPGFSVILLPSTSHAMHIGCKMIPVPRHISSDCGVCIRIARQDSTAARAVLDSAAVEWESIHDC